MKRFLTVTVFMFLCRCLCFSQIVLHKASDAVDVGLQNAEEYKIQLLQVLTGIKLSKYSLSGFLPSLSFTVTESDARKNDANDTRSKSMQFGISQPIFNGGKTKLSYDMSKLSASFQYSLYEQDVKSFSVNLIQTYFNYITQKKILM